MIKPDLITVNPCHVDYPLFRAAIKDYRDLFNKVILTFQFFNTNTKVYAPFIQQDLSSYDVTILNLPLQTRERMDWRDLATNEGLRHSNSSRVLFLEQDFLIKNNNMLSVLFKQEKEVFFGEVHGRIHPGFMLLKRETINKTSLDFAVGEGYDHFGKFTQELQEIGHSFPCLEDFGFNSPDDWQHLNALTYNHTQILSGAEHLYRPEDFVIYLQQCLDSTIPLDEEWITWAKVAIERINIGE